jgi:hypothetical protein
MAEWSTNVYGRATTRFAGKVEVRPGSGGSRHGTGGVKDLDDLAALGFAGRLHAWRRLPGFCRDSSDGGKIADAEIRDMAFEFFDARFMTTDLRLRPSRDRRGA